MGLLRDSKMDRSTEIMTYVFNTFTRRYEEWTTEEGDVEWDAFQKFGLTACIRDIECHFQIKLSEDGAHVLRELIQGCMERIVEFKRNAR